jgi:hypothetical protein
MGRYTLFHLDRSGEVAAKQELELKDDLAALDHAKRVCEGRDVEIWEGTRLAVRIDNRTGEGSLGRVSDAPPSMTG